MSKIKKEEYDRLVRESGMPMPPSGVFLEYGLDKKIAFLKRVINDNKRKCSVPGSAKMTRDGLLYICLNHPDGKPRGWSRGFTPEREGSTTVQKCRGCPAFVIEIEGGK